MTTYSASDWATRALQRAALVDGEDTPPAALATWAIQIGTSLFEQLSPRGIQIANGSDQALPGEYYQIFANYVACDLKAEVGLISDGDAELAKRVIEATLREMNPIVPTGVVQQADYF